MPYDPAMPVMISQLPPTTNLAAAYPDVRAVVAAVRRQDVTGAVKAYREIPLQSGRWLAARAVGELRRAVVVLRPALVADPDDPAVRTMLGAALIADGWRTRTTQRAAMVSRKRFAGFHAQLREAEQVLLPATAEDPTNLAAGALRVTVARGLELGQAEARRRYEQVAKHDPHFVPAQLHLLRQLCPKWGGSFDAMYAFARQCAQAAPPGALNGVVVAQAHIEYWTERASLGGWFGRPEIREEVDRVAARSVGHPDYRPTYGWVEASRLMSSLYTRGRDGTAWRRRTSRRWAATPTRPCGTLRPTTG